MSHCHVTFHVTLSCHSITFLKRPATYGEGLRSQLSDLGSFCLNLTLPCSEVSTSNKNGWAKYIIFSGAAQDANSPSNAEVMKAQALKSGVPASIIIVENASRNTRQNAQNTSTLLADHDIKRVIVVTSPYHQRRAGLEFKTSVNQNITVKNHPVNNDPDWPWYWWATPRGWWLAIGEIAKIGVSQAGNQG